MLKWVEQTAPVSRCASPLGSLGRSHSPRGSNPSSVGLGMACALTGYLAEPMRRFLSFLMASHPARRARARRLRDTTR